VPKAGECTFKLEFPLPGGVVNSGFGPRVHPVYGTEKNHDGIDIKMPDRSVRDVVAAYDGTVVKAGWNNGYGNTVDIEHKDCTGKVVCRTRYAHLNKMYVGVGTKVRTGQPIGLEGTTGTDSRGKATSTGNHLHFEVMTPSGAKTDPMPWFKGTVAEDKKSSNPAVTAPERVTKSSTAVVSNTDMTARDC
jgi:murein DD-endopeptidase MepM/ murein hydrolase activator NlpD